MVEPRLPIQCSVCRSTDVRHEEGDRYQCTNCGHRLVVDADGTVRLWVNWMTAGRKPRGVRR